MDLEKKKVLIPTVVSAILIVLLMFLPGRYSEIVYPDTESVSAKVLSVDDSSVLSSGLVKYGEQLCEIKIERGKFKGKVTTAINNLMGKMEADKIFQPGDRAFVVIDYEGEAIRFVTMVDHYRLDYEIILAVLFFASLIWFGRGVGLRVVLSFILSIMLIWKILIPLFLDGYPPIPIGAAFTVVLTGGIISLVYGWDKRALAAILGTLLGMLVTCLLAIVFVSAFKIQGAVMAFSESLLYAGYQHLNLTQIFTACIFIASSGALMDLAVDITSAVHEVMERNPELSRREAIKSGMNVGRSVLGTMSTTLLLAYSGGYMALLMVFMAQGTPLMNILNLKYVASEIVHTFVGSFGLVTVAPFTAITSGILLGKGK